MRVAERHAALARASRRHPSRARSPAARARPCAPCRTASSRPSRRTRGARPRGCVDRVEDGLLVLLQVAVVGERQPLERREQPGEIADEAPGLSAGELGDVRVLLLRHDARPRRVAVVEPDESELAGVPDDDRPRRTARGRCRSAPRCTRTRRRRRALPCRRGSSRPGGRGPSSSAISCGSSPSVEPASAPPP